MRLAGDCYYMIKNKEKKVLKYLIIIFLIIITIIGFYVIFKEKPSMEIELGREHDFNWVELNTTDGKVCCELQSRSQSYFENSKFLYTYGSTGFVYVNLENGHVYVVPKKSSLTREDLIYHLTDDKSPSDLPQITFLREDQLDKNVYAIMKVLENTKVPNYTFYWIPIYDNGSK